MKKRMVNTGTAAVMLQRGHGLASSPRGGGHFRPRPGTCGPAGRMSALLRLVRAPRRAVLSPERPPPPENPPFVGRSELGEPVGAHFGPENRVKWEHELQMLWPRMKGSERGAVCVQVQ